MTPTLGLPSIAAAARALGISRTTLRARLAAGVDPAAPISVRPRNEPETRPKRAEHKRVAVGGFSSLTAFADAHGVPRGTVYRRWARGVRNPAALGRPAYHPPPRDLARELLDALEALRADLSAANARLTTLLRESERKPVARAKGRKRRLRALAE